MTVLQFNSAEKQKSDEQSQEVLPLSIFQHKQEITISYRGSLAGKASAINCKSERDGLFLDLVKAKFRGCIAYWDKPGVLVIGRFDDVGEYYPDW